MKSRKMILQLNHDNGMMASRPTEIKSSIYQGDSLSPLVFCLAVGLLSSLLNKSAYGYNNPNGKIGHLFYMDDLKTATPEMKTAWSSDWTSAPRPPSREGD